MPGEGPPLPSRFPCMCKAIYSWGGETKRDLGFVEGDLIECLNAGDGQWWMGRLRRNKTVGLFPSNFVEVLEDHPMSSQIRPVSRAASPMRGDSFSRSASPAPGYRDQGGSSRSRAGRSPSPAPHHQQRGSISRAASPNPYQRSVSPNPYQRSVSPNPYQRSASPNPYQRSASPNPYTRSASPNPYMRSVSPAPSMRVPRAVSPTPSHYRATSPAPYQRSVSPHPYRGDISQEVTPPPPPPPPHRYNPRPASPLPPQHQNGCLTPVPSRPTSALGQTPSPLRNAMEDVMESLEHMTAHDRPQTPNDPWSPQAFEEMYSPSPKKIVRPETSLGIFGRHDYGDDDEGRYLDNHHQQQSSMRARNGSIDDRLRRFEDDGHRDTLSKRQSCYADLQQLDRSQVGDAGLRSQKSAFDLRNGNTSPSKMMRPRPLARKETVMTTASSNQSSSTTSTGSTALTSASIMSGISAGGFSATSAGSLARRKAMSMSVGMGFESPRFGNGSRPETPSGYFGSASGTGSGSGVLRREKTWGTPDVDQSGVFGGLATPKPKKTGFLKKILNSAKTSAASARSVASSSASGTPREFAPRAIPDGITAIAGGRSSGNPETTDWVRVRRDVNRANTLSRNERVERADKQEMLDMIVVRPVDALDEDVDGDEAANGGVVVEPQDFGTANLSLVDKAARFISSLPPFTTPESLATHHVCRPHRSDVQRLRAIFTWVSEKIAWEHPSGPIDGGFGGPDAVDTRRVLSQKRGSPEEVAAVVRGMCGAIGVPCEVVRGYLKAPGEDMEIDAVPRPNHWWNAVIVDGEWRFMDCSLASPTHPRRTMYSRAPQNQAEFFYFLTKPSYNCWTHVPLAPEQQHLVPPLPLGILLALPCACPPFFRHGLQMINFDTSLIRLEDLEVAQIEFSVPADVECVAEVEAKGFAIDQDGDLFETGEVVRKRALAQACWENGVKIYRIKAVLPGDEGHAVLKVYAGKRGLMHSIKDNPHPMALALPLYHTGENPPYDFLLRHPTPHAQRHDLYIIQPQCARLAVNNTFVFAVRQSPSSGETSPGAKPAKLGIQSPSGKIVRLMRKTDTTGCTAGMVWETIIKCAERGPWRALVLADRSARWCVYAEWNVV